MKLKEDDKNVSFDEYLQGEEAAEAKHEFVDGEVYTMVGASHKHNLLSTKLSRLIGNHIEEKGCTIVVSDQMVSDRENTFGYYPDNVVYCGKPQFYDEKERVLLNPQVIVEVLSPSTEDNDRGYKAYRYREIESLQDYLILWQEIPRAEHFYRKENGEWGVVSYQGMDSTLRILSINFSLPLKKLYEGIL